MFRLPTTDLMADFFARDLDRRVFRARKSPRMVKHDPANPLPRLIGSLPIRYLPARFLTPSLGLAMLQRTTIFCDAIWGASDA